MVEKQFIHKELIFIILLIVGLTVAPTVAAAREDPNFEVTVPEPTLTPGQPAELTVLVTNDADEVDERVKTADNVEVELESENTSIEVQSGPRFLGSMADGDTKETTFRVSVPQNIESGTHDLSLNVTYELDDETKSESVTTTVRIDDRARFEVTEVDSNVSVGATGTYELTIQNVGSEIASAASVKLVSQSGDITFGRSQSDSRFLGPLAPGETASVAYTVSVAQSAAPQSYSIRASITYEDESGTTKSAPATTLSLTPAPEHRFSIVDVTTNVTIGDTARLAVTFENLGRTVDDATVTLESRSSLVTFGAGTSDSRFVGHWEAGETETVEFQVTVLPDASSQRYALQSVVSYDNNAGFRSSSEQAQFGFTPAPEQSFSLTSINSSLRVGEEGTIQGEIVNTGDAIARNVVVVLQQTSPNINVLEPEFAVGNLAAGERASVSFRIEISEASDAGPRQLSFVTRYRDVNDNTHRGDELDARVHVGPKRDVFAVEPENATLEAGSGATITLVITNQDDEPVSDVTPKLFTNDPLSTFNDEAFIDRLAPGESAEIAFGLSASGSALPKVYSVSIDFQYDDSKGDTIVSDTYKVPIQVQESSDDSGPPLPLILVVVAGIFALLIGGYYWSNRS